MRNPFKKSHPKRGLPDSSMIPVIPSDPTVNIPSNMVPAGYPYNSSYSPPPIAHPYAPPPEQGVSTGAVWEFNTGENKNMKGQQRGGHVSVGNTAAGITFPQNGRFVFNTGKNYNEGDVQENGNVEFGNVY